jgi:hypothetical protein
MIEEKKQLGALMVDTRQSHFKFGTQNVNYQSTIAAMGQHPITSDDVTSRLSNMQNRKAMMRQAQFKLPYTKSMSTEQSTYKNHISDQVEATKLNEGRPNIMSFAPSIKVGGKQDGYSTEFKEQYNSYKPIVKTLQNSTRNSLLKGHHFELGWQKGTSTNPISPKRTQTSQGMNEKINMSKVVREHTSTHFKMGYIDPRPITANFNSMKS